MSINKPRVSKSRKGISKRRKAIDRSKHNEEKHIEFVQFLNAKSQDVVQDNYVSVNEKKSNKVIFLPPQTVFKELYDCCDTEAKLILLDEISMLGDDKELSFVVSELEAPEALIREKAARIIPLLKTRIKIISLENSIRSKETFRQEEEGEWDSSSVPLEYTLLLEELEINSSKLASISKKEPTDLQNFIQKINLKKFTHRFQR
ncbi:hypothetical protein MWU65_13250 [Cellulophaga sp. F20128]|uniref:hypothetical protein n=1 Tax=Cellulophaga sp. F20128 TaxID=2926413 RepID=UPI001FF2016B|nr:hypothetical protein [Cellulophaga sp. F20128]MCK0158154.1 hypothetical protein [Cellulophaga sp. F20128]